ncbi:putative adhesin [Agarilytica rhodophyticola]|uniref:putative adhesin n=1 Tax=Agarilytica rhodophyticola TaxID=1737490 RepID=UPI000B347E5E|nr:hypothetical protein [Agarilytica rhodophyticola]
MINIYVNGHGYIKQTEKFKADYKIHTYVKEGEMFDGRELSCVINDKAKNYPSRSNGDPKIEVHEEHAKQAELYEHLLVTTQQTYKADLVFQGFFKASKDNGVKYTQLSSGKLYFLKKATQVYVTDYDKIVPFSKIIKEVKDEILGPHVAEFHWTACRSMLTPQYCNSEKLIADLCFNMYESEGDTRRRKLV